MFKNKEILKRILLITLWVGVASVSVVLLVAATRKHATDVCEKVIVDIFSGDKGGYIREKEVLDRISGNHPELLTGTKINNISLSQLESVLEQHLWIRNAEMFFDNKNILHIEIEERVPVARVFSVGGESFYVDEKGVQLPVNGNQIANVPVFTGFPQITYPLLIRDSLLLIQVRDMGNYILKDPFWKAQIDQINIENYQMELIPKLGKHQIFFGEGNMVDAKFKRLMLFYKQIMKKTGWNYYSQLDVRYDKQLVAVRRDSASLYQSFVIPFDTIKINDQIDSLRILKDTSLSMIVEKSRGVRDSVGKEASQLKKENNR
jgi:cell division protein FtsQ